MGVFAASRKARTFNFRPAMSATCLRDGSTLYRNIGTTPVRFLEVFKSSYYADVSLNQWLALTPPELVKAHLSWMRRPWRRYTRRIPRWCGMTANAKRQKNGKGRTLDTQKPRGQQHVELAQGILPYLTFKIVLGAEQALPSGLALAACDGAEGIEPASNGAEKAFLGFHVGLLWGETAALCLIGTICPAQSLDGSIGLPSASSRQCTRSLRFSPTVRRDRTAGAAGVGENEDALGVVHECLGLPRLRSQHGSRQPIDRRHIPSLANDPARAARHLGHDVGAEALHDLVERAMNRRQRRQLLDQPVTS